MTAVIADGYYRIVSALSSSLDVGGIYMNYNANDPAFPAGTHAMMDMASAGYKWKFLHTASGGQYYIQDENDLFFAHADTSDFRNPSPDLIYQTLHGTSVTAVDVGAITWQAWPSDLSTEAKQILRFCLQNTNLTLGAVLRQDGSGLYDVQYVSYDEVSPEAQGWTIIRV